MERIAVNSSTMLSVGFDPEHLVLEIEFNNGRIYKYMDVPEYIFRGLINANSLGQYFNNHIRYAGYSYIRLK